MTEAPVTMTEASVTTKRRSTYGRRGRVRGPSPYDIAGRLLDDAVPYYGMITIYHKDEPHKDYTVRACKHFDRRDQCLRCSKLCEHDNGKASCLICNRCIHMQHQKLCKLCNNWTCNVEGCLDKGRRFCSKQSLKHHTTHRCPNTPYMTWGGRVPSHLNGPEFLRQSIANRSESSAASESNVQ